MGWFCGGRASLVGYSVSPEYVTCALLSLSYYYLHGKASYTVRLGRNNKRLCEGRRERSVGNVVGFAALKCSKVSLQARAKAWHRRPETRRLHSAVAVTPQIRLTNHKNKASNERL